MYSIIDINYTYTIEYILLHNSYYTYISSCNIVSVYYALCIIYYLY